MRRSLLAFLASMLLAAPVVGQTTWLLEVSGGVVGPRIPSVTVRVSAIFPSTDFAWAYGGWNMRAAEGQWSGLMRRFTQNQAGSLGTIQGGDVLDIRLGQFNVNPLYADPANPFPVWEGTWTTDDFRPRIVNVRTETFRFDVYPSIGNPAFASRLSQLVEGEAFIRVIPTPAAWALMLAVLPRRSRRAQR